MRILSFLVIYGPVAFLGFWHWYDWGGAFGWHSGLWTWSARMAVLLLAAVTVFLFCAPPAELPVLLDVQTGLGLGIAIFPGAACSLLSSRYTLLAAAGATRLYAVVGWFFILWAMERLAVVYSTGVT